MIFEVVCIALGDTGMGCKLHVRGDVAVKLKMKDKDFNFLHMYCVVFYPARLYGEWYQLHPLHVGRFFLSFLTGKEGKDANPFCYGRCSQLGSTADAVLVATLEDKILLTAQMSPPSMSGSVGPTY